MNERIRELARQACITIVPEPFDDASHSWNNTMEKFAELIVREMLQTCEDHPAWTGRMLGEQIKQRFGVEE